MALQDTLLRVALEANVPVFLYGEPGIGKTATIEKLVQERDGVYYLFQVAQRDPVDLTGAMSPFTYEDGTGVTRYFTPEWVYKLNAEAEAGRFVCVVMDEVTTAAPMSLNATLTLVQSRKAGEYQLHPDIRFVLAGNPPGTNAGVYDLPAAFANRIVHISWTVTPEDWAEWASKPGAIAGTGNAEADTLMADTVIPIVSQFVKNSGMLLRFPKTETEQGKAWPSPRSWEMAVRSLAVSRAMLGTDPNTERMLLAGIIGEAASSEFVAFERDLDLPDPEEVLKNAAKVKLPERQDQLFVMLSQVVARVQADFTAERHVAAWQLLSRVADEKAVDIAASQARVLAEFIYGLKDKSKLGDFSQYLKPFAKLLQDAGIYAKKS